MTRPLTLAACLIAMALGACTTTETTTKVSASPIGESVREESGGDNSARRRAKIRLDLGASYYQSGNYKVALDELNEAQKIDPSYPAVYGVLGLLYMDMREEGKAESTFRQGLRLAPDDSDLNNNYGWYLCRTGHEADSLQYFQNALKNPLYQTPARPLHNAGICSLRMGDEKQAEGYFLKSFQVDPSNAVAMFNLAEIYLKRNQPEKAKFYSERLLKLYQPDAQTLWLALRISRRNGDADGAASYASQLRRMFPNSPEFTLLTQGKYDN